MAYVDPNYKYKKEFIKAVKDGVINHYAYNPSGMFPQQQNGREVIEGPHAPKAHSWYASVILKDGIVVKVLK